jgi:hypothetical protein
MGMSTAYTGAGSDDAESIRTIHRAIDLGVTLGRRPTRSEVVEFFSLAALAAFTGADTVPGEVD